MQTFDFLGSKIFFPVANGGKVPELGMYLTLAGNIAFAIAGVKVFEIDADGSIIPGNMSALVLALQPYYAVEPPQPVEFVTTPHVMIASEYEAVKNVAGSAAVTLPPNPIKGQIARVGDIFGDLVFDTINITVTAGAGSGAGTINGQAQHVMWGARQHTTYRYNGTEWNIVCAT